MDVLYCINESVYSDHITKGNSYLVKDQNDRNYRIKNNNDKLVWLPRYYFTPNRDELVLMKEIHINDEILDMENDCVEVSIGFDDGSWRCCIVTTPRWIQEYFQDQNVPKEENVNGFPLTQISLYHDVISDEMGKQVKMFSIPHLIILSRLTEHTIKQGIEFLDKKNDLVRSTLSSE